MEKRDNTKRGFRITTFRECEYFKNYTNIESYCVIRKFLIVLSGNVSPRFLSNINGHNLIIRDTYYSIEGIIILLFISVFYLDLF